MGNRGWKKEEKKSSLAEESFKTRRAREKLKKQLEAVEKKITPQALERKMVEIHRWIARHAPHRVVLRTKSISLFDENQNTAKISSRISLLAEQIKKEMHVSSHCFSHAPFSSFQAKDLKNRVIQKEAKVLDDF